MKKVVLIRPHIHKTELPFQLHLYDEWINTTEIRHKRSTCPTWRWLFHIVRHICFPKLWENNKEAHIVLVGGGSINWGAWPDYMFYETIPVIWDCWPIFYDGVFNFIERNKVKTVIVTSKQTAKILKERFPFLKVKVISEGIKTSLYKEGELLVNRKIDLLEYGRPNTNIPTLSMEKYGFFHVKSKKPNEKLFHTDQELYDALSNSKVTFAFPRCMTEPETAQKIETLTQRYWENMLSRTVMVGKAPNELIDLIGYDPVVTINDDNIERQVVELLNNIESYQELVDKNRQTALKYSSWGPRIIEIEKFLVSSGYTI